MSISTLYATEPIVHDRRLVRLYLQQSMLRFYACFLPFMAILAALWLTLLGQLLSGATQNWAPLCFGLPALLAPALGCKGMVRAQLQKFSDEGRSLTEELVSPRIVRELASPFDIFTTFDLCAEALSSLATGHALGLSGPPAFAHDPFRRTIVLGSQRPFRLFGGTEVRLQAGAGESVHITIRRIASGDFLRFQTGSALRAVEAVVTQLQASITRRQRALDTASRAQAAERSALQARLSALQAQVEPHFLFNTLANLKYLVRTDGKEALRMLDHLIAYLQNAMPDMRSVSSTVGRELALAHDYLSLMQIRMGQRLQFEVAAPASLDAVPMPPAMLISLVENALKHGLALLQQAGMVHIAAALEDQVLVLRVRDNGAGLAGSATHGEGTGLANIHARLALLYNGKASLTVMACAPSGTEAVLRLPVALPEQSA
ncbi:sensor histidine kinase [Janthinobacterium aquaticum]|uniref:sensor histidine kinase n=1 Tax=Janthinobacterium sp. FT58W TaxID=2654254 RepID=UPI001263F492|nr:histidine kinase [Janthinobacterium sp. FT58W]KAB8045115.1 hypothetical protein GCM43_01390 [Janthinobacterium sp. FT58W]